MISRRVKIAAALVGLLIPVLVMNWPLRKKPVTFAGWQTIGGVEHAVFDFPPVRRSSPSQFWFKWRYEVGLDFECEYKNGQRTRGTFVDSGGSSPARSTGLAVPLPAGATAIRAVRADTALYTYWDLLELPISPPVRRFVLETPAEWYQLRNPGAAP